VGCGVIGAPIDGLWRRSCRASAAPLAGPFLASRASHVDVDSRREAAVIEARGVSRSFGDFEAVRDLSFRVDDGEIVGMLGPNGAGKTTTIRMITGFLPPSAGSITIAGHNLLQDSLAARRCIGYLPESLALYPEMRVEEYLTWRARLHGLHGAAVGRAVGRALERCLIEDVRRQIIRTLSKGYRQRVGLAMAILHEPRVLILDEPTVGLDPAQIIAIRELIRDLGSQHTVLLSTHILPEVELLCDRVQILDRGRIIAEGTSESLQEQWLGNRVLRVTLKGSGAPAAEALERLPGVRSVAVDETVADRFRVDCEPRSDSRQAIFELAVERGWVLLELSEEKASLEEVFVQLTTHEDSGGPEAHEDGAEADA